VASLRPAAPPPLCAALALLKCPAPCTSPQGLLHGLIGTVLQSGWHRTYGAPTLELWTAAANVNPLQASPLHTLLAAACGSRGGHCRLREQGASFSGS